jgi:hypothetical protein
MNANSRQELKRHYSIRANFFSLLFLTPDREPECRV